MHFITFYLRGILPKLLSKREYWKLRNKGICCSPIHPLNSWLASLSVSLRKLQVPFLPHKNEMLKIFSSLSPPEKYSHKSYSRYILRQWLLTRSDFFFGSPRGHFTIGGHFWLSQLGKWMILTSGGGRPRRFPVQHSEQDRTHRNRKKWQILHNIKYPINLL